MSRCLTVRLNEDAFCTLQQEAQAAGISPEELAAVSLERHCVAGDRVRSVSETQAARERFEQHFGEIDLRCPTGADNDGIDADLARECADTHEAE